MKKLIFLLCAMLFVSFTAFSDDFENNLGFYKSPGMLFLGGTQSYMSAKNMSRDKSIKPYLMGMLNVFQNEYGNIALTASITQMSPTYRAPNSQNKINFNNFLWDLGLNYMTGSDSYNVFLGGGVSFNSTKAKIKSPTYNASENKTLSGYHLQVGAQAFLTKRWGLFLMYKQSWNGKPNYSLGGLSSLKTNLNSNGYMMGVTFSF